MDIINYCRGKEGTRIKYVNTTLNGVHLITEKFDKRQFAQELAINNMDSVDIHDDNPTLLYYKND